MKTRTIQRTRLVPHTIDGRTEMVLERYDEEIPVPPRDWDRIILTTVTAIALVVITACVAWSTASIGALLDRVVIAPAAYGAALVFDAVWIACMGVEYLARYDQRRARLPRAAGWCALVVAMAAVAAHGWLAGYPVIGAIGAGVSGLAKGLWTVVLAHHTPPLDDKTRQWVERRLAAAGASLALIPVTRQVQRAEGLVAAERAALRTSPDASPEPPEAVADDPEPAPALPAAGPMTIADAVRTAWDSGLRDEEPILRYVRKVADANAKPETVSRYIRLVRKGA